ncbi:menaquinol oxidoreductase [Geobacter sulfurreducens]|jgi:hypothetical protein|uniref:Menaquinol oxidoreductase n=1 Tax=Geobacter sulfurreducens (strain ATCC 51573 / DSM 12127 / PCA) TaxID=243231 RepID=Q74FL7_GEOSL|nr:hypothetical protein [Geobacter sulfurreducens]AAR33921.1 hypothetical protein GSU0590 [Geobacter sulfurreducens PCA]ADI83431.1 menaquinol oxidoreductase complex Cbc5, membrane protein subunit, putative [Geobacter sulfurreducens KN400]AJY70345.1 menaquinol oxidoreductase [Geobacter sulfurreducens]QVW35837.1 menaquinol oxidoreductase [Geobacter sulfurreducens]UAC04661.1 menaquinol oxidoreductase [Geobacter sulfurreducens]
MKRTTERSPSHDNGISPPNRDLVRQEAVGRIRRYRVTASRGLWAMALFLAVSTAALWDFSFLPPMSDQVRAFLGKPPSATMISGVLMLYTFSAIILILARMMGGAEQYSGFAHVGYLTAFYLFYHFARALNDNYWAVFVAGITILGLESYHIWNFCSEAIRKDQEIIDTIDRNRRE